MAVALLVDVLLFYQRNLLCIISLGCENLVSGEIIQIFLVIFNSSHLVQNLAIYGDVLINSVRVVGDMLDIP